MTELDRKAPCHCGSGKRYKSCCQAKDRAKEDGRTVVAEGHAKVDGVMAVLLPVVESRGEYKVACRRGCNHCCAYFVRATLPEAEAIADWLARPEQAALRARFEERLPSWRAEVGAPLEELEAMFQRHGRSPDDGPERARFDELVQAYEERGVLCPFVADDGGCGVYQRRPVACRAWIVVGSSERCRPGSIEEPQVVRHPRLDEAIDEARALFERSRTRSNGRPDGALPLLVGEALARR